MNLKLNVKSCTYKSGSNLRCNQYSKRRVRRL